MAERNVTAPKTGLAARVDRHDKCRLCGQWTHSSHMHRINLGGKDFSVCSTCIAGLGERRMKMDTSVGRSETESARPSKRDTNVGDKPRRWHGEAI